MKTCRKCGVEKPRGEFWKASSRRDGLQPYCKLCQGAAVSAAQRANPGGRRAREARYRLAHPDRVKAKFRRWLEANREYNRSRAAKWRGQNVERRAIYERAYYWANREREIAEATRWNKANRDRVRANARRWIAENYPRYLERRRAYETANRERVRQWCRDRRARLLSAPGEATAEQVAARMAFYGWMCWMCGAPFQEVDHVIPISRGGSNWPANLRPACRSCNASKGNRRVG